MVRQVRARHRAPQSLYARKERLKYLPVLPSAKNAAGGAKSVECRSSETAFHYLMREYEWARAMAAAAEQAARRGGG